MSILQLSLEDLLPRFVCMAYAGLSGIGVKDCVTISEPLGQVLLRTYE